MGKYEVVIKRYGVDARFVFDDRDKALDFMAMAVDNIADTENNKKEDYSIEMKKIEEQKASVIDC